MTKKHETTGHSANDFDPNVREVRPPKPAEFVIVKIPATPDREWQFPVNAPDGTQLTEEAFKKMREALQVDDEKLKTTSSGISLELLRQS